MPTQKKPGKAKVLLFFGGIVVLFVLAFTLGVIVGKGIGGSQYVEKTPDFREEAISPEEPAEEDYEKPATQPDVSPEDTSESVQHETFTDPIPGKEVRLRDDLKESMSGGADEEAGTEDSPDSEPQMREQLQLREKGSDYSSDGGTKVTASDTKDGTEGRATVASRNDSKKTSTTASPKLPQTDPGGIYTVQLGSFKNRELAQDLERKMSSRGYPSFLKKTEIPGQGEWYRVRIGTFNEKKKAENYADILLKREDSVKNAYVTTNN